VLLGEISPLIIITLQNGLIILISFNNSKPDNPGKLLSKKQT